METQSKKWIVYDGNCGMCLFTKKVFSRLGFFDESQCRNYHELEPELYKKVGLEQFRHGMAYVETGTAPTRYGLDGVLAAFSERRPYLHHWTPDTRVFKVLNYFYNAICYNRYFIFPKKQRFACSCEPEFHPRFFRRWLFLSIVFSVVISGLFGSSLASVLRMEWLEAAGKAIGIVGTGWAVQALVASLILDQTRLRDYLRHIALIMFIGVLLLLPAILLFWLPAQTHLIVALLCVIASSTIMTRMHIQRMRFMGLGQQWTVSWFLVLQSSALALLFHFQILSL